MWVRLSDDIVYQIQINYGGSRVFRATQMRCMGCRVEFRGLNDVGLESIYVFDLLPLQCRCLQVGRSENWTLREVKDRWFELIEFSKVEFAVFRP
jgi:hypothetical protein